jgi:hypothetical protein
MESKPSRHDFMRWRFAILWFALLQPLFTLLALGQSTDLPVRLGPLKLADHLQGREAQSFLNNLHDKEIAPKNSVMGRYREGNDKASLYISIYASQSLAAEASNRMTRLISAGNKVFTHYRQLSKGKTAVGRCEGLGQTHFFFQHRNKVYWLSADPRVSDMTLQALSRFVGNGSGDS